MTSLDAAMILAAAISNFSWLFHLKNAWYPRG